jgi:hypothetical protein
MCKPRRRVRGQHLLERLAARSAAESAERVENWQVRLARAELFEALSDADMNLLTVRDLMQQRLGQRRLSGSWIAGHEDQLPLTRTRLREQLVQPAQFVLPTNDEGSLVRSPRRRGLLQRDRRMFGELIRRGDGCYEAISPAVNRFNELWTLNVVVECLTDLPDTRL